MRIKGTHTEHCDSENTNQKYTECSIQFIRVVSKDRQTDCELAENVWNNWNAVNVYCVHGAAYLKCSLY